MAFGDKNSSGRSTEYEELSLSFNVIQTFNELDCEDVMKEADNSIKKSKLNFIEVSKAIFYNLVFDVLQLLLIQVHPNRSSHFV